MLDGARKRHRIVRVHDFGLLVQQVERPLQGEEKILHPHPDAKQVPGASGELLYAPPCDLYRSDVPDHETDERGDERAEKRFSPFNHPRDHDVFGQNQHAAAEKRYSRGQEDHVEAQKIRCVQCADGVPVEAVEYAGLGAIGLDHLDCGERFLQSGRQVAVGDAVGQGAPANAGRRRYREPADGQADNDDDQGEPGIEGGCEGEAEENPVESHQRADDAALDQVDDHRAVLVDPENGIADPGIVVEPERQGLCAFDHGHPQILVDALPDPAAVVPDGHADNRRDDTADRAP